MKVPLAQEPVSRRPVWYLGRPAVPRRVVALSVVSLAVPVVASFVMPEATQGYELLAWLFLLVPAFLLAYFRGSQGVMLSLLFGVLVLIGVQAGLTALGYRVPDERLLLAVIAAYVLISIGIGVLADRLHAERMRAEELALTDELTGLPNRRYARLTLNREFAAAKRGRPLVVVYFDLDRFKQFNDRHGHAAGDEALRLVADTLAAQTREMNISGRWGGEEFLSVLSSSEIAGALVFVERVKSRLREQRLEGRNLTLSCGLAAYQPGMQKTEDLLAAADAALYEAKAAGVDSLRVHQPPPLAATV